MSMKMGRNYRSCAVQKRTNFTWTTRYTLCLPASRKCLPIGSGKTRRSTQQLLPTAARSLTAHVRNAHIHTQKLTYINTDERR